MNKNRVIQLYRDEDAEAGMDFLLVLGFVVLPLCALIWLGVSALRDFQDYIDRVINLPFP